MKIVKKNVYYCEFCGKRSLRTLAKHESRCTANPDRECGICKLLENETKDIKPLIEKYRKSYELIEVDDNYGTPHTRTVAIWTGEAITLKMIKEEVDQCPACTLAIINLSGLNKQYNEQGERLIEKLNLSKELQSIWGEINESKPNYECN